MKITGKNTIRALLAAASIFMLSAVPAMAAETTGESLQYQTSSAGLKEEIGTLRNQLNSMKEENKQIQKLYDDISSGYKVSKQLPAGLSREDFNQAKAYRREISVLQKAGEKTSRKETNIKELVNDGRYDEATETLENLLAFKKEELEPAMKVNALWKQIEKLLAQP